MEKHYIYKIIRNDVDVKYTYVGSTKNISQRISGHKGDSKETLRLIKKYTES